MPIEIISDQMKLNLHEFESDRAWRDQQNYCLFIIYYSDYPYCNYPLGVESGAIPDEQITATKSHAETAAPKYARLNTKDGAGAWCHPYIDREDDQQYLQVKYHLDDLRTSLNVCFHNISLNGVLR